VEEEGVATDAAAVPEMVGMLMIQLLSELLAIRPLRK
jgi:hypothetical protein